LFGKEVHFGKSFNNCKYQYLPHVLLTNHTKFVERRWFKYFYDI